MKTVTSAPLDLRIRVAVAFTILATLNLQVVPDKKSGTKVDENPGCAPRLLCEPF